MHAIDIARLIWSAPHNPQSHAMTPLSIRIDRRWKRAFAAVAVVTVALCYHFSALNVLNARIDGIVYHAVAQQTEQHKARADFWERRYNTLADSAGEAAVFEATMREQEGR